MRSELLCRLSPLTIGVGVLIVGAQIVRRQRGLKIEMFSVIVLGGYLLWKALSPRTEAP